ncbi:MAG TPA: FtsX-like permease family protein [Steroidobacteraceae bacterium]|nr:FtsX-like permease family protein [Steroidobacteraceae bacterium]
MSVFRQLLTVSAIGVSTLPQRHGTSFVIVAGVACVVAVLVSMLSIAAGQTRMSLSGGGRDRAIIQPKAVTGESNSNLGQDQISIVLNAPGIARGPEGSPLADPEFQMGIMPPLGSFGDPLEIRGIGPTGIRIRDEFRIEAGRLFRPGVQELLIGVGASKVLGLRVGDKVLMPGGFWPIVGIFSNGGDASEGVFFADARTLLSATKRKGYASVIAKLASPESFDEMHDWIGRNPALALKSERVSDYFLRSGGRQLALLTRATYVIGVIMALGALFGATKIMYAAVRARTREIGTLRAVGFGGVAVAGSVLLEAMLLALIGAALGTLVAWLAFDGRVVYSGGVFRLHVSAPLLALGLAWGAAIALLGGVFPAIRAGRLEAATALRAV